MRIMKKTLVTIFALSAAFVALPRVAQAHHGWADFDSTTEVSVKGTVIDFHFVNPHCVVELEVMDEKGVARKWQGEFASPAELARYRWTAASLEAGDRITVTGHAAKNGSRAIHVLGIRLANGQELKLYNGR